MEDVGLKDYVDARLKAIEDSIVLAKAVTDTRIDHVRSTNNMYFSYFLSLLAILISAVALFYKK